MDRDSDWLISALIPVCTTPTVTYKYESVFTSGMFYKCNVLFRHKENSKVKLRLKVYPDKEFLNVLIPRSLKYDDPFVRNSIPKI